MDWSEVAPMLVAVTLILTTGGVMILRPLTKRLGDLIEVMIHERRQPPLREGLDGIHELLERQSSRLELIERRQDFTESLLSARKSEQIPSSSEPSRPPEK